MSKSSLILSPGSSPEVVHFILANLTFALLLLFKLTGADAITGQRASVCVILAAGRIYITFTLLKFDDTNQKLYLLSKNFCERFTE